MRTTRTIAPTRPLGTLMVNFSDGGPTLTVGYPLRAGRRLRRTMGFDDALRAAKLLARRTGDLAGVVQVGRRRFDVVSLSLGQNPRMPMYLDHTAELVDMPRDGVRTDVFVRWGAALVAVAGGYRTLRYVPH